MRGECNEMQSLLPWLVNDTLGRSERYQVLHHLTQCETCRLELALLVAVSRETCKQMTDQKPAADVLFQGIMAGISYNQVPLPADGCNVGSVFVGAVSKDPTPAGMVKGVFRLVMQPFHHCLTAVQDEVRSSLGFAS